MNFERTLAEQVNQMQLIEIRQPVSNFSSNKEFLDFRKDLLSRSINPWLIEVYQHRANDEFIPISIWALVAVKINDSDKTISRLLDYQEFDDSTTSLDETMSFMEWVEIFNPTSWGDWLMVPPLFSNYLVTGKNLSELVATPDPWLDGLLRESRGRLIWKTQLSEVARVIGNNYDQIRKSFMIKKPGWEKSLANIVYPKTNQTLLTILEERTWNMQIFGAPDYILSNWLSIHSDQKNKEDILMNQIENQAATIKIIGIGGFGGSAIDHMMKQGMRGVEYIVIDTDKQALSQSFASVRLEIDINFTDYLASTVEQRIKIIDRESLRERIKSQILNADIIFIIAGMGGNTGTELSTIVAQMAHELNIMTVAVIPQPFTHDMDRIRCADEGIKSLYASVDSLMIVPSNNVTEILINDQIVPGTFSAANAYIYNAIKSFVALLTEDGEVEIDFTDVRQLLSKSGFSKFGTATAAGSNRAQIAAEEATSFLLLENNELLSVKGLLVNMTHGNSFSLREYKEVMQAVRSRLSDDDAVVIVRASYNKELSEKLRVTIFATNCIE